MLDRGNIKVMLKQIAVTAACTYLNRQSRSVSRSLDSSVDHQSYSTSRCNSDSMAWCSNSGSKKTYAVISTSSARLGAR